MTSVVILHSAYGRRPAVVDAAKRLEDRGHDVYVPDYYDGEVFDDLEHALAKRDSIGIEGVLSRTWGALDDYPDDVVYVGLSLGARPAQLAAATRPGTLGLVLLHGAHRPKELGLTGWPPRVPIQIHRSSGDPWVDREAVDSLATAAKHAGASFRDYVYPGDTHLFTDLDLPDGNPTSARSAWTRIAHFCDQLPA